MGNYRRTPMWQGMPDDLAGCVSIKSGKAALEFVRFFSSFKTVHFFEDEFLEIYQSIDSESCDFVCINSETWARLKLHKPVVTATKDGFQITRYIIRPHPEPWMVTLYRRVEHVTRQGRITWAKEYEIKAEQEDLTGLIFPMYL